MTGVLRTLGLSFAQRAEHLEVNFDLVWSGLVNKQADAQIHAGRRVQPGCGLISWRRGFGDRKGHPDRS
jgi:hypothetical protein